MKKLSLLTLAFLLSLGANTFAQSPATSGQGVVLATANIVDAITVTAVDSLTFPDILQSSSTAVDVAPTASEAGLVEVTGATDGVEIDLEITFATTLADGGNTLPFSIDEATQISANNAGNTRPASVGGFSTAPTQASAGTINAGITPSGTSIAVAVGGRISPAGSEPSGTYTTDITVAFSYN